MKVEQNPYRISIRQVAENEGVTVNELISIFAHDSVMPALCSDGCQVEPDGRCQHGCPSICLALGVI